MNYQIPSENEVMEPVDDNFHVQIKSVTGSWKICLNVVGDIFVLGVKRMIMNEYNAAPSDQRLNYDGQLLDDNCSLSSYGIKANFIIYVVLPFYGASDADNPPWIPPRTSQPPANKQPPILPALPPTKKKGRKRKSE